MKKRIELSSADLIAIEKGDSNYINSKGANLYNEDTYAESVEYYRLAAAMGNVQAISNLGYCYLYGRGIEQNIELAIAYFKTATYNKSVDASYKLGNIYSSDEWNLKDKELSIYYYRMAASYIIDDEWNEYNVSINWNEDFLNYPSLCLALGKELMDGSYLTKNIDLSYQYLLNAQKGYEKALLNGNSMYEKSYKEVLELLDDSIFLEVKERLAAEEDDDDNDNVYEN